MFHDRLGRRKRTFPVSTGKRLTLQPTDHIWLEKLYQHGPLPSSYLLAFTRHLRKSDKRAKERLTDLFNEDSTRHDGRYLIRPPQQFHTIDSRYNQLVYDLAPAGVRALKDANVQTRNGGNSSGPWVHRFMVACTTASIELACLQRTNVSFIPQHAILARAEAHLRLPTSINDTTGSRISKDLIPDALFGLEYQTSAGSRFRFFAVECDRATEPATSPNFNRKSWQRSLRQYREYVEGGVYRDHLKLTAPLAVLNVTTHEQRLQKLIAVTEAELGAPPYQLFQAWPDFGQIWRPPAPNPNILAGEWLRARCPSFRLDQA